MINIKFYSVILELKKSHRSQYGLLQCSFTWSGAAIEKQLCPRVFAVVRISCAISSDLGKMQNLPGCRLSPVSVPISITIYSNGSPAWYGTLSCLALQSDSAVTPPAFFDDTENFVPNGLSQNDVNFI